MSMAARLRAIVTQRYFGGAVRSREPPPSNHIGDLYLVEPGEPNEPRCVVQLGETLGDQPFACPPGDVAILAAPHFEFRAVWRKPREQANGRAARRAMGCLTRIRGLRMQEVRYGQAPVCPGIGVVENVEPHCSPPLQSVRESRLQIGPLVEVLKVRLRLLWCSSWVSLKPRNHLIIELAMVPVAAPRHALHNEAMLRRGQPKPRVPSRWHALSESTPKSPSHPSGSKTVHRKG